MATVIWLTGLSGSGKTTLANALSRRLERAKTVVLDGDTLRKGLCSDLGFAPEDRTENVRRVGEVAALFVDAGINVIVALISPQQIGRDNARATVGSNRFLEVFLDVPIEVCERRDPKGLYKRVRQGEIPFFTGISAPYERPIRPDLVLDTAKYDVETCVDRIVFELRGRLFGAVNG